jgi:hypothetical protein
MVTIEHGSTLPGGASATVVSGIAAASVALGAAAVVSATAAGDVAGVVAGDAADAADGASVEAAFEPSLFEQAARAAHTPRMTSVRRMQMSVSGYGRPV